MGIDKNFKDANGLDKPVKNSYAGGRQKSPVDKKIDGPNRPAE